MTLLVDGVRATCPPAIIASGTATVLPNPGPRYLAFPIATTLADGRVIVAYQDNQNHFGGSGSAGKLVIGNTSGTSFGAPITLVNEADPDTYWWAPVGIARRGSTVAILQNVNNPRRGFIQTTTNPATWPAPREISWGQSGTIWTMACHLAWVEAPGHAQGIMLATAYTGASSDPRDGVLVAASLDSGATWQRWGKIAETTDGFNEATICRTAAGDLLALIRKGSGFHAGVVHAARSSDHGQTWSAPQPAIWADAGMPTCTLLPDGRLVVTVRDLAGPAYESWSLAFSDDDGHTWTVAPVTADWMMYGQVVVLNSGSLLLVGGSQDRTSSTRSDVWTRPLQLLSPMRPPCRPILTRLPAQFSGEVTVAWEHRSPSDTAQAHYELRYRLVGATDWSTATGTTAASHTLTLSAGQWEVQVRTMGADLAPSRWSDVATITTT